MASDEKDVSRSIHNIGNYLQESCIHLNTFLKAENGRADTAKRMSSSISHTENVDISAIITQASITEVLHDNRSADSS